MKGVVVIPNAGTSCAAIQRDDGFLMVVEPLAGACLEFMVPVELGDIQIDQKMHLKILVTDEMMEVLVKRIDLDISWEDKMALLGKSIR
jgi:isopentenyl phosphate kinase